MHNHKHFHMRKPVTADELIVGQTYFDLDSESKHETVLKFVALNKTSLFFTYISGRCGYVENKKRLIEFPKSEIFYK